MDAPSNDELAAAYAFSNQNPHQLPFMQQGAECWRCALKECGQGPVAPSIPEEPHEIPFLVVAEAPGTTEVQQGRPLVGASGNMVRKALQHGGMNPDNVGYTNTILCRPPDDLKRFLAQVNKRKVLGQDDPIECCRPRLLREVKRARFVMLMGSASLQGVGIRKSITKLRGTPVQIPDGPPAVPVLHAAFVMRDSGRHLGPVFRADVGKAVRLSRGGSTWQDPPYQVIKNAQQLEAFLSQDLPWWAVDTETDGVDPWSCRIRRIGIGNHNTVAIYSPLSVNGTWMMSYEDVMACTQVFNAFFQRVQVPLVFHNWFGFDSIVMFRHGFVIDDNKVKDTLIGHHVGSSSELPHRLDFLGSVFTDAPYWKDDVKHSDVKTDEILDKYLSYDVAVTAISAYYVAQNVNVCAQDHIYQIDAHMGAVGRSMSRLGIRIDREKQLKFAEEYQAKAEKMRADFYKACGREVNPASPNQLRKLLYHDLKLPLLEEFETSTGEPSTAEPVLLALLGMGIGERERTVIKSLLGWREADKVLSTYTGRIVDGKLEGGPPLHEDGRLRTTWKPYGAVTGRWSSGDPTNLQNIIKKLRAMYVPHPGNVFVAADYSALELRILAERSQDPILIEAFRAFDAGTGPDIHKVNGATVFKCSPEEITDEPRTFAKRFVYGLSYGAGAPKIFQTLSLLRDDDLKPVFPNITLQEIERVYKIWWDAHPKIVEWQRDLIAGWRRNGFIESAFHKRRRYFIGGEDSEQMKNFPIQSTAADLQNNAVAQIVRRYPFDFERNRGLVLQVHDQTVVECGEDEVDRVKAIIQESMQCRLPTMFFPAEAKEGSNWKAVS